MMPASTTLASSQPRWGDQKAPITAAPKTSQNPFRHLVGRGAPCVSASSKAPAGHAAVGRSRPAFIGHRNYPFVVVRRYRVQGSAKGWRRRTNVWREATSPARGFRRLTSDGSAAQFLLALPTGGVPVAGSQRCRSFTALWRREVARKLNMSWHHPDLYFFLCLLAGFAAFLAFVYTELFGQPLVVLEKAKPLDGLHRDRPARPTEERASQPPSDFSRLSESVKDLPPKEQASRVRQHFGILGGARPAEGRGLRAKNAGH